MKKRNKTKGILMIPPQELPIPSVGGGAIETLITQLLEENEKHQKMRFVVISVANSEAEKTDYGFSKVYYNENGIIKIGFGKRIRLSFLGLRIYNKFKRIIRKLGITIPTWNSEVIYPDFFYYQCAKICRKEKIDIVISENDNNTQEYKIFHKLVGKENIYYHLHCVMDERIDVKNVIPNSISISRFVRQQWVNNREDGCRNIVLNNCIDINKFNNSISADNRNNYRAKYGIAENDTLVIYCGRLIPEKGIDILLEAIELLKDYPVKLLLIGSVGFSKKCSTEFSERVIAKAESMGSVIFLGYIPNDEMPFYYQISDIQVIPSVLQEGAGLVSIEGMAAGLPLIVTESGGMVEYVTDECAIKLPIDDELPVNIANNIKLLTKNHELCQKMGAAGKQRAKNFTKERYYQDFYREFGV